MRVLTWNLFHGRDFPPEGELMTRRSRWLRRAEIGERYAQVNRPLRAEFAAALAALDWDVALLQEHPPRWLGALARAAGADGALVRTSRNTLPWLRALLAELNTDLVGSDEGGSNALIVRPPWRIREMRALTLTEEPERRRMQWALLEARGRAPVAVANMHLSTSDPAAAGELELAAEAAAGWAGPLPLVFGGDLNLRADLNPEPFERLAAVHDLAAPTSEGAIDHVLVRGLEVVSPPRRVPDACREVPGPAGRLIRLSDHAIIAAEFAPHRER